MKIRPMTAVAALAGILSVADAGTMEKHNKDMDSKQSGQKIPIVGHEDAGEPTPSALSEKMKSDLQPYLNTDDQNKKGPTQ